MTRRAIVAILLSLALGFALGRVTVATTPRSEQVTQPRPVPVTTAPNGVHPARIGAPFDGMGGAPSDPTAPPADHAGTPVVVPSDAPVAKTA